MREHVRKVEDAVLAALARGETVGSGALLFLLRLYRATARDDLGELAGPALAQALLAYSAAASVTARADWLVLFVEAATCSDDDRLREAIAKLTLELRDGWTAPVVADASAAIGATLHAAGFPEFRNLAAPAIDRLEAIIGAHYRPGRALGGFADQVRTASALLTAYGLSGRLPYPMLAEELMQTARQRASTDFVAACEAARVLCRLAALHQDAEYRSAAVIAPNANYEEDAVRVLAHLEAEADRRGAASGIYGVAWLELESAGVQSNRLP